MKSNITNFLFLFAVLTFSQSATSQVGVLNALNPNDITAESIMTRNNDKMLMFNHVNDQDVMWYKIVWEKVDLKQKINQYLYYPTDTLRVGRDRRSLFDVLLTNIKDGKITEIYADSYFNEPITYEDIEQSLSTIDTLDAGYEQLNAGEKLSKEYIVRNRLSSIDIKEIRVKGMWYFDRRVGLLRYRPLGIAPASRDVNFLNDDTQPLVELFWVWYRGARDVLHEAKVFSKENTSSYLSFDQIFITRRFKGIIYKENNVYNDRPIVDYIQDNAYLQLMEARDIKDKIRNHEEDMWAY